MMRNKMVLLASLLVILAGNPAAAALIEGDLNAAADGLITVDTDTGLEWLDLNETLGLSYNQALATTFVQDQGFRHATFEEVTTLFLNAGFLTVDNVNNPANTPAAELLLGLVGCTQFCGTINATGRGFADGDLSLTTRPNYRTTGLGGGAAIISLQSNDLDLVDATAGNFLVRAPEPTTGLLLALGLAVGLRRRANR